jgi:hypothetical protein
MKPWQFYLICGMLFNSKSDTCGIAGQAFVFEITSFVLFAIAFLAGVGESIEEIKKGQNE